MLRETTQLPFSISMTVSVKNEITEIDMQQKKTLSYYSEWIYAASMVYLIALIQDFAATQF